MSDGSHNYTFGGWPEMPWKRSRWYRLKAWLVHQLTEATALFVGAMIWLIRRLR